MEERRHRRVVLGEQLHTGVLDDEVENQGYKEGGVEGRRVVRWDEMRDGRVGNVAAKTTVSGVSVQALCIGGVI